MASLPTKRQTYDDIGHGYGGFRIPDRRLMAALGRQLGAAVSVLNVGAGTGSYEPRDRPVVAAEPSWTMIRQRPRGSAPAVRALGEALPFADRTFDAALAILTLHHWSDWRAGVAEMRRVSPRVVIQTWDPSHTGFWLTTDYFPDLLEVDRGIFPPIDDLVKALGGTVSVEPLPIPADCTDGFLGAYWCRPKVYLDNEAGRSISTFSRIRDVEKRIGRLARDLETGRWHDRNGALLERDNLDLGYRLVTRAADI